MNVFETDELEFTADELETMKEIDSLPLNVECKGHGHNHPTHRRY